MNKFKPLFCAVLVCATLGLAAMPAYGENIETNRAVLRAMDKITGRFTTISAPVGSTVTFGSLEVDIKTCLTRPPEETPENTAFLTIREKKLDGSMSDIFKGWMFSSSPALSAMEHPVFDIWILECRAATAKELKADSQKEINKVSPFLHNDDVESQSPASDMPGDTNEAEEIGEDEAAERAAEQAAERATEQAAEQGELVSQQP